MTVRGVDFTFRPQPTIHLLWALGDEETRRVTEATHEQATERALEWIEDEVAVIRYRKDGIYQTRPPKQKTRPLAQLRRVVEDERDPHLQGGRRRHQLPLQVRPRCGCGGTACTLHSFDDRTITNTACEHGAGVRGRERGDFDE